MSPPQFQFHIGTIKRRNKPDEGDRRNEFQFHIGTIKRER